LVCAIEPPIRIYETRRSGSPWIVPANIALGLATAFGVHGSPSGAGYGISTIDATAAMVAGKILLRTLPVWSSRCAFLDAP